MVFALQLMPMPVRQGIYPTVREALLMLKCYTEWRSPNYRIVLQLLLKITIDLN